MATTTERPSAKDLQEQKAARVAEEQAKLAEARERAEAEAAAEFEATAGNANGHRNGAHADAQDGLFDTVIENNELEAALEDREKRNNSKKAVTALFKEADEKAKGIIAALEIEDGATIRVGRFRISKTAVEGRSVSFDTEPTTRLTIAASED